MINLTKKEIETIKTVVKIELGMIGFLKGFNKDKKIYEITLEKILKKLER